MKHQSVEKARLIANTLYQFCNEGLSLNSEYDVPRAGYMVSMVDGPVFNSVTEVNVEQVRRFIEVTMDQYEVDKFTYFGVWTDKETGKIYFDFSFNWESKEKAIQHAQRRGQIAIWDVENKCEIRL